jgi:hypothetical protein
MADKYTITKDTIPRKHWHLSDAVTYGDTTLPPFEDRSRYHDRDLVGLCDSVTFKVNCCKARHTVTYTYEGELILHDHDEADLEQLRMLRTFGGGVSRCLQIKEQLEEALKWQGHMGFQYANHGDEDAFRALPKAIFHYRRSRCKYIRAFRRDYRNKTRQPGKTEYWKTQKRDRLNSMYQRIWRANLDAHGECLHVDSAHAPPFDKIDRWEWYKYVHMRGLNSAVYASPAPYRGDRCFVINSDPNWMLGDKTLRVMYLQKSASRSYYQRDTNRMFWGTARLEDKWYITPDENSSVVKWGE